MTTGLVSARCYAAGLRDCDGGPSTAEHFLSDSILQQFGANLIVVDGASWSPGKSAITSAANLKSRVLCGKHNSALSDLDAPASRLYSTLARFHEGVSLGTVEITGAYIERWMLKVLFGLVASGNINRRDGRSVKGAQPSISHLRVLFGMDPVPPQCALRHFDYPPNTFQTSRVQIGVVTAPVDGAVGEPIVGVKLGMLGLNFFVGLNNMTLSEGSLRPRRLRLGDQGVVEFLWDDPALQEELQLLRYPPPR